MSPVLEKSGKLLGLFEEGVRDKRGVGALVLGIEDDLIVGDVAGP